MPSADARQAVEELYREGATVREISDELELSFYHVVDLICCEDRLRQMYLSENLTQSEIGERLGLTQGCISRRLSLYDIETETPPFWSEKEEQILKDLYGKLSPEEITKEFPNRSWNAIKLKAMKLGVAKSAEEHRHSDRVKEQLQHNARKNMIEIDFDKSSTISYILGVVDGDGFHDKTSTIGLEATSKKFVEKFAEAMETVGMNPGRGKRRDNRETVWGSSKQLVDWMMDMGLEKKFDWITTEGDGWNYIEGRYESDGNITNNGTARICSYDAAAKQFISRLLKHLGIDCSIQQNNVYVFKSCADDFFENIDPVIRRP